jgi:CheY-like chemotaxis protein
MGARIETADDGLAALEALRAQPFDLVLMDIHMPRMDGVEALAEIRAGRGGAADIPVIALTADAMSGDAQRLLALGFDAVQPKPIQPVELIAAIAEANAGRTMETPKRSVALGA